MAKTKVPAKLKAMFASIKPKAVKKAPAPHKGGAMKKMAMKKMAKLKPKKA